MNRILPILCLACWSAGAALAWMPLQTPAPRTNASPHQITIPYVPTRHDTVKDLLWLAGVGPTDVVYDLGSGDGRIAIAAVRDFGARRAVGLEVNPQLIQESRAKAAQAGLGKRVQFIQGDLFTNDFSPASVAVFYLGQAANLDLRATLVGRLKPGARLVSHQFGMGEWPPDKLLDVRTIHLGMYGEMFNEFKTNPEVPDFDNTGSGASHDVLLVWMVPAPVAGVWRGNVRLDSGEAELQLILHQRLSGVTGFFQWHGTTPLAGGVQADLWGDHLRCWFIPTNQNAWQNQMWFDGHANADALSGRLSLRRGQETSELDWLGRRDRAEFTGTWEWPGPSQSPVQLRIQRRNGRLAATYLDQNRLPIPNHGANKPIPVADFFDFGGGFYFTLLLGLEGGSLRGPRRQGPEDGWLIGEAMADDKGLSGTIAFYPYRNAGRSSTAAQPGQPGQNPVPQQGRRDWRPKRVAP